MTNSGTGWERDKRGHFDEIVTAYDKIRPSYPPALIADVMKYCDVKKANAVEIGAGTGKATAPFVEAGYDVTAVEIGAVMAEFLSDKFDGCDNFRVIVDAFEDVQLTENEYDLIYAGSAFHWVDAEIGCPKSYRLLKPGGVIALFRYNVIPPDGDAMYEEVQAAYDKHYRSYYTSKVRRRVESEDDFFTPDGIDRGYGFTDLHDYGFRDIEKKLYRVTYNFTAGELLALYDTLADHRSLPDANRAALYADVADAVKRHGGIYREHNVFQLYMGRK